MFVFSFQMYETRDMTNIPVIVVANKIDLVASKNYIPPQPQPQPQPQQPSRHHHHHQRDHHHSGTNSAKLFKCNFYVKFCYGIGTWQVCTGSMCNI